MEKPIVVTLIRNRDTKHTWVYKKVDSDNELDIDTLYIQKAAFMSNGGAPLSIKLTVEEVK